MSSRNHTIFIINLQDIKDKVCSKIKLCDLGEVKDIIAGNLIKN